MGGKDDSKFVLLRFYLSPVYTSMIILIKQSEKLRLHSERT